MTPEKESRQQRRARERGEAKRPAFARSLASRVFYHAMDSHLTPRTNPAPAAKAGSTGAGIDAQYILFCRVEDDQADGWWTLTGADSAEEGDWLARELQRSVTRGTSMGSRLSTRCELVANDDEALGAWAAHSVKRKRALAHYGETGGR